MAAHRPLALLRGINVGGSNVIKMADLRAAFENMGFASVETYIQSGNVVFSAKTASKPVLTKTIESALGEAFACSARIALVSAAELERVVAQAPEGFGQRPDEYRYDVLFVMAPATPSQVLEQVPTNPDVDTVDAGAHAVYFRRVASKASQSRLPKLVQKPVYRSVTIRNWNTTTKLLAMVSR